MQKDLKIGMFLGLLLVAAGMLWLSTHPALSTKARMLGAHKTLSLPQVSSKQLRFATNLPGVPPTIRDEPSGDKRKSIPDNNVQKEAEKIKTQRFHIVRKGETLSDISQVYYGSANMWHKISSANRIGNPTQLKPGTKLIIPE